MRDTNFKNIQSKLEVYRACSYHPFGVNIFEIKYLKLFILLKFYSSFFQFEFQRLHKWAIKVLRKQISYPEKKNMFSIIR